MRENDHMAEPLAPLYVRCWEQKRVGLIRSREAVLSKGEVLEVVGKRYAGVHL